jgi:hypothetical protein
MEPAHQEDRQCRERLAMRLGAEVGRQRHLADVEFEPPDHPAEGVNENRDLLEGEAESLGGDGAILEGAVVPLGSGHRP